MHAAASTHHAHKTKLAHLMAREKMHCALRRSNIQKDADGENSSLNRKFLKPNTVGAASKDFEASSIILRNSGNRCAFLTFLAVEPNGHWRVFAMPLQCPINTIYSGSRNQVNVNGLHLVSPSSVSSVKLDRRKAQKEAIRDGSCSFKSLAAKSSSDSNSEHQSRSKVFSNKEDKAVKNSRKKVRKGKRNKKLSGNITSLPELECARGSSTSETGGDKDRDVDVGLFPCATTTLAVSLPENRYDENCSEKNSNDSIDISVTSMICTSNADDDDASETFVPSVPENCGGKYSLSCSENGLHAKNQGFSIINGGQQDTSFKQISCSGDSHSNVFSEIDDSLVLDSLSLGSSNDGSYNADYDFKLSTEGSAGIVRSDSAGHIAQKGCFSPGHMSNIALEDWSNAERTSFGQQGCTSGDRSSDGLGKRENQIKRVPKISSFDRNSSVGNLHGHSMKETNNFVWQKVRRHNADECNHEVEEIKSGYSQFEIGMKESSLLEKHRNVVNSNLVKKSEDKNQINSKVCRKPKRKTSPGSKQEHNIYCRNRSHVARACSNMCAKVSLPQNDILDTPAQISRQKELNIVSRSHSMTSRPKFGFQGKKIQSLAFKPVHRSQACANELEAFENVCTTAFSLEDRTAENQTSLISNAGDLLEPLELLEEPSAVNLHTYLDDRGAKANKGVSPAVHIKQDTSSGVNLQKQIRVGVKDSGSPSLVQASSVSKANLDELASVNGTLKEITEEEFVSNPHALVFSRDTRVICTDQRSENVNGLHSENEAQVQNLIIQGTSTLKKTCNNHSGAKCLTCESTKQNISASENGPNDIVRAVNDAHKVQLASEAIHVATGCPIAEFERVLQSASPVICPSQIIENCTTCLHGRDFCAALCRHEMPNISLGSLWQWYEKPGSCGLEVKCEDNQNSKRLGIDRFAFRAYFVPYLSAVQLFRKHTSYPTDNACGISCAEAMVAREMGKESERSSNMAHLSIFSVLIPLPRTESSISFTPKNHVSCSEPSSVCIKDNASLQPFDDKLSDDMELLFEYFESDQPQQRRPLFEMIKELIRGGGPSQRRAYGDPTILDSAGLCDLHPNSWYSVAWYPIYRIPDGNFHAAFLTYHSLGHFIRRGPASDSHCVDPCIVSPVVGLQSYNAEGECWFKPRHPAHGQAAEISTTNPSGILKDRLRTLEQTASLMARAVVTKGSETSINRQSDYEFFLSRQRRSGNL